MVTVLHVLEALATGCARHLVDLVRHVDSVEHVVLCPAERHGDTTDHTAIDALLGAGAVVEVVDMRRRPHDPRNAAAMLAVRRAARRHGAAVVHGHSSIGGAVARLGSLGTGAAVVYTPNGLARGRLATATERVLGRTTDRFIAVSASEAEDAARLGLVAPARIVTIPNGVDTAPPAPRSLRELLGVDDGVPLVGFVGRLAPQKAPEVFAAAAALVSRAHPEAVFVLVGDGPQAARLQEVAARVPSLRLVPHLPGAAAYLHDLAILAQPSRFEGGPYVPLEAMRVGVPVVVSDVTGNRDAVVDGESGLVVPADDPDALAAAVVALLQDPAFASRIGTAGRARLEATFDVRGMAAAHAALYEELARR